jgi:CcmD family protein
MDDNLIYVVVSFVITGLVIGVYLWTLRRQQLGARDEFESLASDSPHHPDIAASPTPERRGRSTRSTGA